MTSVVDIENVGAIIKSITGGNEDAFQDTWLYLIESGDYNEENIKAIGRAVLQRYYVDLIRDKHRFISIETPLYRDSGTKVLGDTLRAEDGPRILLGTTREPKAKGLKKKCKYCGAYGLIGYGNSNNNKQRLLCRKCRRISIDNSSLPHMKTPYVQVAFAIEMHNEGMNLRAIRRQLERVYDNSPSLSTICRWLGECRTNNSKQNTTSMGRAEFTAYRQGLKDRSHLGLNGFYNVINDPLIQKSENHPVTVVLYGDVKHYLDHVDENGRVYLWCCHSHGKHPLSVSIVQELPSCKKCLQAKNSKG